MDSCGGSEAQNVRDASDELLRAVGGVTLVRTAMELRGVPCNREADLSADPDSVSCSRCFGEAVTTREALVESLASFAAQAAEKLRRHRLLANGCNLYAQRANPNMFESRDDLYASFVGRTVVFPQPTDATHEMLSAITPVAESLYVEGCRYRKSGVVFFGLEKSGSAHQMELFSTSRPLVSSRLYETIDGLNQRYGKETVVTAREGLRSEPSTWRMKREHLSPRASSNWAELMTVR